MKQVINDLKNENQKLKIFKSNKDKEVSVIMNKINFSINENSYKICLPYNFETPIEILEDSIIKEYPDFLIHFEKKIKLFNSELQITIKKRSKLWSSCPQTCLP